MANEKNLIPQAHILTVEEASKGGQNSGKARREKKTIQKILSDGGLSALENAFWVLEKAGCKVNSNGTIQRKNLFQFMNVVEKCGEE